MHERLADQVADLVVGRRSAADVLDRAVFSGVPSSKTVQLDERRDERRIERGRREHDRDSRRRRSEGGSERSPSVLAHLDSDWAGRAILERYLLGEGDWDISDIPAWTAYLMRSSLLRRQLTPRVEELARRYQSGTWPLDVPIPFAETFKAELENGEGIVGYQYLHGTNADVGGFQMSGIVTIAHPYGQTNRDGSTSVSPIRVLRMQVAYRWNDMIDPNPQYGTDTVKSRFAEVVTLGQAQSYRISITWHADCEATVSEDGAVSVRGYPVNL